MNIFVLDPDPRVAAAMHCDQHMNKMIVESAQMLSTVLHLQGRTAPGLMKPAYHNHPCTRWIAASPNNFAWVVLLAKSLEHLRCAGSENAASAVIRTAEALAWPGDWTEVKDFVFAGLSEAKGETVVERYHSLYRLKHAAWASVGRKMTYNHRPVPSFMADLYPAARWNPPNLLSFYSLENLT